MWRTLVFWLQAIKLSVEIHFLRTANSSKNAKVINDKATCNDSGMLVSASEMDHCIIANPKFVVQETAFAKRKHGSRICNKAWGNRTTLYTFRDSLTSWPVLPSQLEDNFERNTKKWNKQTWHILVVRRHLGFYERNLLTNQCVSCVTPAKTLFVKRRGIFVTFRDISAGGSGAVSMAFVRVFRGCYRLNSSLSKVVKGTEPFLGHCKAVGALSFMKKRHCSER